MILNPLTLESVSDCALRVKNWDSTLVQFKISADHNNLFAGACSLLNMKIDFCNFSFCCVPICLLLVFLLGVPRLIWLHLAYKFQTPCHLLVGWSGNISEYLHLHIESIKESKQNHQYFWSYISWHFSNPNLDALIVEKQVLLLKTIVFKLGDYTLYQKLVLDVSMYAYYHKECLETGFRFSKEDLRRYLHNSFD